MKKIYISDKITYSKSYQRATNIWNMMSSLNRLKVLRDSGINFGDTRSIKQKHRTAILYIKKNKGKKFPLYL